MEVAQVISDDELIDPPEGGTLRSRGDAAMSRKWRLLL
jgi:hypothetical protein